ncbi:vWA domain-containing protein [Paenibacillus sp. 1P07SE]|uniref:vWA domain-containing protein n=1 Tax=Paenibacillus sp. 1P07SE TaxID=3132209 RepID=UPI0039A57922
MLLRIRATSLYMLLALTLLFAMASPAYASPAGTQATASAKMDAVLVLDVSKSMNSSDPDNLGSEAMKMFIDMLSVQGDRVGIVAFTDRIEREKAMLSIQTQADKDTLKSFIDQLDRGTYTDTSVGLTAAMQQLRDGADPDHEPLIILFTDGNNDYDPSTGRTAADSDQEKAAALQQAQDHGIPVYAIGLNANGALNSDVLAEISEQTGGKSFATDTADDLPRILSEIFASHQELNIVPVDSFTADGNVRDIPIQVPNANVLEANISVMSSQPVEARLLDPGGAEVAIPSDEVLLTRSSSYSLIKLLRPAEGEWTLQIKGVPQDRIDINLIFTYDLELAIDPPAQTNYAPGDEVTITASLVSGGQPLQDAGQYSNMTAVMYVKDIDTGQTEEAAMTASGPHFEGVYTLPEAHDYEIVVRAEEASFYRESPPVTISAKAGAAGETPPPLAGEEDKPFPVVPLILGILGAAIAGAAIFFLARYLKQANRGFVGQLVLEIRDENTGDKSHPQYKKLNLFKGKFHLHQLLQLAPELKETERIVFRPGSNDRLVLQNGSGSTIERSGRAVDAAKGVELKNGDRVTVVLSQTDKTISIEYIV